MMKKTLNITRQRLFFGKPMPKTLKRNLQSREKKLILKTMTDCLQKEPETKTRKLCEVAGISKSSFYYNRENISQELKDREVLGLLMKLPKKILERRGNKAKSREIKIRFGKAVNHKRIARICRKNGLLAKNRRRKFPKGYYRQQNENKKNLPKNILNRNFESGGGPLKKLCTDVSYFKTTTGLLYLSPVLDLCCRKVQCYSVSPHNDDSLSGETLDKLFALGNLGGSILHSERGVLYTSKKWRECLKKMVSKHEPKGKLLGQCLHGAFFRNAESGERL